MSSAGGGSIWKIRFRRLMDIDGFLNGLGVFPDSMAGNPIEDLTSP